LVSQILAGSIVEQQDELDEAGVILTEPEVIILNDVVIVYFRQLESEYDTLTMYVDLPNGDVMSVSATALRGELAQFEDQLFAVASTLEYTRKPCSDTDTLPPD
jgi:hypothetical protein